MTKPPAGSGKPKASKGKGHGRELAPSGSPIRDFPIGSCVKITGLDGWYVITMRLGGSGGPHVRRLSRDPASADWMGAASALMYVPPETVVMESCWPLRQVDSSTSGDGVDPLLSMSEGSHSMGGDR